ncbi:unnamed protein product [Caenorhabditis brenneri]
MLTCIRAWYTKANESLRKKVVGQTIYLTLPFSILFLIIQILLTIFLYYYQFVEFNPELDYYLVLYFVVVMVLCWVARTWFQYFYDKHNPLYIDMCEMDLQFGFFMVVCYFYCTYIVMFLGQMRLYFYFFFLLNSLTVYLYFVFIKNYMVQLDRRQFKNLHSWIFNIHYIVLIPLHILTIFNPLARVKGSEIERCIYHALSALAFLYMLIVYTPVAADLVLISLEGLRTPNKVEPIRQVEYGTGNNGGTEPAPNAPVELNPADLS